MPKKLKTWRKLKALSQRELATKAGMTAAALNRIETGKSEPIPRTMRAIAAALDIQPSDIDW